MPKHYTFSTFYDEVLAVSISKLRECGYLKPNQRGSGILTWSSNGKPTGSISMVVVTCYDWPHLEINNKHSGKPVNYTVDLVSVPSKRRGTS